jgi:hypothetical protein
MNNKISIRSFAFLFIFSVIFNGLVGLRIPDIDFWGYISFGRLFWNSDSFPYKEVFTYVTKNEIFIYHEWLTGVILYKIYSATGETGVLVLKYLIGFVTSILVYKTSILRLDNDFSSALCLLFTVAAYCIGFATFRAQIFTYFFFVLTAYLLELYRIRQQNIFLIFLPLIIAIWCNLHGGFLSGLGLIILYCLGAIIEKKIFLPYLVAAIFSFSATLLNPYHFDYLVHIFDAVTMNRPLISEWWPIHKAIVAGYALNNHIFFIICVIIVILISFKYRYKDITDLLILSCMAFLSAKSNRHEPFFFLSFGIYFPKIFYLYEKDRITNDHRIKTFLQQFNLPLKISLLFFATFIIISSLAANPLKFNIVTNPGVSSTYYPLGAVDFMKINNLSGKILTDFEWGEYIIWEMYPECKVGMDARYEAVYPTEVFNNYANFYFDINGWKEFLINYSHDFILLKSSAPINKKLKNSYEWKLAYEDIGSSLYIKNTELGQNFFKETVQVKTQDRY